MQIIIYNGYVSVKLCVSPRATLTHTETQNMKTLPSTLDEIRKLANTVFADPRAASVNIDTTFGIVTVFRDGKIHLENFQG